MNNLLFISYQHHKRLTKGVLTPTQRRPAAVREEKKHHGQIWKRSQIITTFFNQNYGIVQKNLNFYVWVCCKSVLHTISEM